MTDFKGRASPFARLQDWYHSPLGLEVARIETICVQQLLSNTFGYFLVQLGVIETFREALASSRIRYRVLMPCEQTPCQGWPGIVAEATALPLASDGIDAILLPHTLDFTEDPLAVLREVERVLIPEGRVIILGFNALSIWGLWGLILGVRGRVPWCGRFRTSSQVEEWLSVLGFAIEVRERILFCPPFRRLLGQRCAPVESFGRRFWPLLGGVYVIRAVKRVATLTPLRPSWSRRRAILGSGAVEPTTRGTGHA